MYIQIINIFIYKQLSLKNVLRKYVEHKKFLESRVKTKTLSLCNMHLQIIKISIKLTYLNNLIAHCAKYLQIINNMTYYNRSKFKSILNFI